MGFFSKLKDNMNSGGVDVHMQAPSTAKLSDPSLVAQITLTSKDQQRTVQRVSLELHRQTLNQSTDTSAAPEREVVARADYTQPISLQPGQPLSLQLELILNKIEAINEQVPENDTMKGFVQGLSKLQQINNAFDQDSYTYELRATADVDGITFDPSFSQPIQMLKPGQFGVGFNGRL